MNAARRAWVWGMGALALLATAGACSAGAPQGRGFCVIDTDCPGELVCDEGTCWEGAEAAQHDDALGMSGAGGSSGSSGLDDVDGASDELASAGASGSDGALGDDDDSNDDGSNDDDDTTDEAPFQNPPGQSRCELTETTASCTYNDTQLMNRLVRWQLPLGKAPAQGWPTVIVFQGSGFGPDVTWQGDSSMPFGGLNQIRLQASLLDHGFAVIAPAADGVAWATNFPNYEGSTDHKFIPELLDALANGELGDFDMSRLYATGISSGGYMTSRMAVTYPGNFAALAIESGSYATCSNVLCAIPAELPADHPPTLFLHGQNDVAVPIATMQAYDAALRMQGTETKVVIDPAVGHGWLKVAPEEITAWFMGH